MEYLRYLAEDSESWDETKEHESQTTREEELVRETSSVAFAALCAERPGDRWPVLQSLVDAEDAARLLLARELTLEEKREFVDLRIEGWLRDARRHARPRAAPRVVAPARAARRTSSRSTPSRGSSPSRSCAGASGRERAPPHPRRTADARRPDGRSRRYFCFSMSRKPCSVVSFRAEVE